MSRAFAGYGGARRTLRSGRRHPRFPYGLGFSCRYNIITKAALVETPVQLCVFWQRGTWSRAAKLKWRSHFSESGRFRKICRDPRDPHSPSRTSITLWCLFAALLLPTTPPACSWPISCPSRPGLIRNDVSVLNARCSAVGYRCHTKPHRHDRLSKTSQSRARRPSLFCGT